MGGAISLPRNKPGVQLLKATRDSDAARLDELLSTNPAAASYCTLEGVNCLHVAAAANRADLLERLLIALRQAATGTHRQPKAARRAFNKAINQKNVHGQTPLMLACKAGATGCVHLLLEAGADATLFDDLQQRTCLHYAALYGWAEAIDALLGDDVTVTTADGQRQLLREALMADSQGHHRFIDGRAGFGLAPLHLAASQGHMAAVKALLKWGASLTVRCNTEFSLGGAEPWTPASTPLHFAAARGKGRVVQAILQAAAERQQEERRTGQERQTVDVRLLRDWRGHRPYDIALITGHRPLLWALNPRVPLAALVQQPPQPPVVPSLAALAAAALRQRLVQQLEQLRDAAAEAWNNGPAGAAEAAAAAAAATGGDSRRGSRAGSREGTGHGGTAYAAAVAAATARTLQAALVSRLSCSSAAHGRRSTDGSAVHKRRASDGGCVAGGLYSFHSPRASDGGGSLSGSRHGGTAYLSLCPPAFLPHQQQQQQQQATGCSSVGSPRATGPVGKAAADGGAPAGSIVAGTSITSAAGCPVCLDCRLEVAIAPCGHGLCLDCASHLSSADDGSSGGAASCAPPLCPLCRAVMAGFNLHPY